MSLAANLYPANPTGVPADLTAPTSRYRLWVVIVLVSLFLFVFFYLALVAASGYLVYLAFTYPIEYVNKLTILLKLGSIAASVMLFLFLLKGLFKRQQTDDSLYVEIKQAEQPELFGFIRQVCRDTRAPFPYRVFISPEVNAAVFYNTSLLNLILPVRKNLLIGLGLVNAVTLNEFKAVMAHEFGHFSQSSMALGSYVYVANRIITDMVYARDRWDDLLAQWRQQDIRIAVFGWILSGVVWVLRKVLEGAFRVINLANLALSRQMEFNADLVAVSVTGSDAPISVLARLEFASECLAQAAHDLSAAADHRLHTRDMFHHQTQAADYLRRVRQDPNLGNPPPLPEDPNARAQVFHPGAGDDDSIWSSHPSHYAREQNAKRRYVRSPADDRSPWLLFRNPQTVRATVTRRFYQTHLGLSENIPLIEPETVQTFIDEEHAETTYDAKYHGLYDNRYVEPGDLDALAQTAVSHPWQPAQLAQAYAQTYGESLKEWMEQHARRQGEYAVLSGLDEGELKLKGKTFEFRDQQRTMSDVKPLRQTLELELENDQQRLVAIDRTVFLVHYQMARVLGNGCDEELLNRYRFHLGVQDILRSLLSQQAQVEGLLGFLSSGQQLSEEDFTKVVHHFRETHRALAGALASAGALRLPALRNVQAGTVLSDFLLEEPLVSALSLNVQSLSGEWVRQFLQQSGAVREKARRVHFKSLGGILALQERIVQEHSLTLNSEANAPAG
jgi:Zn-dependent protease with chaperone function